jgi:DNA adenine methylase
MREHITSPAFRYPGQKWRSGPWIIEQLPPHTTYVEPFAGGCAILLQKPLSMFEVINDLNDDLINFFDVLRSRPAELIAAIDLTPYARAEYMRAYESVAGLDDVERARRFYVRSRQSFGSGEAGRSTGWRFQKTNNRGKRIVDEWSKTHHLWAIARRFKEVMIEHDDAFAILDRYDAKETLFYVDPPYLPETRAGNHRRIYAHEMNQADHVRLAEKLRGLDGMVVLSGYPSTLYNDLYQGWRTLEKSAATNGQGRRTEKLWISPNCTKLETLPMFASRGGVKR